MSMSTLPCARLGRGVIWLALGSWAVQYIYMLTGVSQSKPPMGKYNKSGILVFNLKCAAYYLLHMISMAFYYNFVQLKFDLHLNGPVDLSALVAISNIV